MTEDAEDRLSVRKVFGRGVMEALTVVGISYSDYKEIKMNAKRKQSLLQGLPPIPRRVLDIVPISECWPSNKILYEYTRQFNLQIDMKQVEHSLRVLLESGLIMEPKPGMFRKPPDKEKAVAKTAEVTYIAPPVEEPAAPVAAIEIPDKPSPLESIGALSAKLKAIAKELDDVGIAVEEQLAAAENKNEKLKQLQQLLKSLG